MTKLADLKNVTLTNKTVLLDVSHVKAQGDEITQGGIMIGKVLQSEVPTYGYVVGFDPAIETLKIGDVVPIAQAGSLRVFEWPGKSKDQKVVSMRFEFIDGVISL
jgi:hypothetical protein